MADKECVKSSTHWDSMLAEFSIYEGVVVSSAWSAKTPGCTGLGLRLPKALMSTFGTRGSMLLKPTSAPIRGVCGAQTKGTR